MLSRTIYTKEFAVATEHYYSSLAAYHILKNGGNAFDACIAASFALTVLQPHLNGLGGDFFALLYSAEEDKVYCINSSGWYYKRLKIDNLKEKGYSSMPEKGAFSTVVPGYVKGIFSLYDKFASFEMKDLIKFAIKYANEGFPISKGLANALRIYKEFLIKQNFINDQLVEGSLFKQPELANALNLIAENGPNVFYNGEIAESIVKELNSNGVEAEIDDFKEFNEEWVEPIYINYRGFKIYEVPPNSMGATTLLILKLLEQTEISRIEPTSEKRINEMLKSFIAAYKATEENIADSRFINFDLDEFIEKGRKIYSELNFINKNFYSNVDTTYFSIVDKKGNLVSAIQSLFHHFGSGVYIKDYGFFLNNRASAFKFDGPNKLEPRKRPLHTLSALLIGKDEPTIAIGTSGGYFRPQQHSLFVTNLIDYKMKINEAIEFPRFLWSGENNLILEEGYKNIEHLKLVVNLQRYPGKTGVAQAVEFGMDKKTAVCDIRGDGFPLGE